MKKHIPNTITALNLISGCIAVQFALFGDPLYCAIFIVLSAVFDFFDGFVARLLKVSSDIGKEEYMETVRKFKAKWFKGNRNERLKGYIDDSVQRLRTELLTLIGEDSDSDG